MDAFSRLVDGRWTLSGLKPAEDVIDAIVAAWVGIVALAGGAEPFGDEVSAIWVSVAGEVRALEGDGGAGGALVRRARPERALAPQTASASAPR